MKKIFFLAVIFSLLFLSGCGKKQLDENGCFTDAEAALKYAERKNRDVLLFVTMEDNDSATVSILKEMASSADSSFVLARLDFSQKTYEASVSNEELANQIQKNTRFASMLNVSQTPSVYILSKESYVLTTFVYEADSISPADFKSLLEEQTASLDKMRALIQGTKKGKALDKVRAIDELYEATVPEHRVFLAELIESVIKLDKNNESGLLGKYIYAAADVKAAIAINQGKVNEAVKSYVEAAENPQLEAELKQQSYYIAAYLCSMTGSAEKSVIVDYLQKAIEAAPESKEVASIQKIMEIVATETLE